ncbi:MAG: type IV secretion system DNA-binding domain-containing protein [Oscillospiraceae bacterium]|jgi:type IV secretory pathway TraG/TraD family ATPase VirD4|nr:type IV secretion system DNA-binding domain-containing protein [Oscillospiraceae bacterium]
MRVLLIRRIRLKTFKEVVGEIFGKSKKEIVVKNEIPQEETLIGFKSGKIPVYTDDKAKHIFICGTTGSGKTVALSNYIKSAVDKNYPLLLIDGKGDINDGSMLDIVHKLKKDKKLYVINMVEPATSDKYNPFMGANPTTCKDMLINMSEWSEEHYKANTERYLERLIRLLNLSGITLTFKNIIDYMPSKNLQVLSAKLNKEGLISKDEHLSNVELTKTSGEIANSACARFSLIQESEIGNIFDISDISSKGGIDIHKALAENAIILFILNPLCYPELSPLLGRLILIDSKKAVSKMFTKKIANRLFFIMDEINVYASPTLIDLINKSRSAGVTCIPATQSLADLEYIAGEAFKNQIIENCNNYIIMRQNSAKSAEEWANIIGTKQTMEVTYQIEQSNQLSASTGKGSAKLVREYKYHPDDIKSLRTGEAVYLSKDQNKSAKIKVHMPF